MAADPERQAEALLEAVWTSALDPLFWRCSRTGVESAWYGHVPFAHWLVGALEPRCIVELGTHNGASYAAFCEAVQRTGLGTRCFAVDTWAGDEHAGFYGEEVFARLRAFHDPRFGAFSTLIRSKFDDALDIVEDGAVDLLHIDGRHRYEDVRHDFETWRGKLSPRGVVLFHDINVHTADFGVWRLWSELQREAPSFEFLHAHGLGVLMLGPQGPPLVAALTQLRDTRAIGAVRERFAQLGERCVFDAQVSLLGILSADRQVENDALRRRMDGIEAELVAARRDLDRARADVAQAEARYDVDATELRGEAARLQSELGTAEAAVSHAERERLDSLTSEYSHRARIAEALAAADAERAEAGRIQAAAAAAQKAWQAEAAAAHRARHVEAERRAGAEAALDRILLSGTWRATRPVRTVLSILPAMLRRRLLGATQVAWRAATPHLNHLRRPLPIPAPLLLPMEAEPVPVLPPPQPAAAAGPVMCYISGEPDTPGTIYRVNHYAAACRAAGAQVTVLRLDQLADHLTQVAAFDVVVIWRAIWTEPLAAFVHAARGNGARIVFDVDDLMIDPALATTEIIDGIRSQGVAEAAVQAHYARVQQTMLAADYCTSSTTELTGHMQRFGKTGFVLPNGFDRATLQISRMAMRCRRAAPNDGLLRIGYASGSRTHQRDFAEVARILPAVFRRFPECRLVLFQVGADTKLLDLHEFPELKPFADQIEWRELVPLARLPEEIARFDVNLAPLQLDNLFCQAKSELKYFEAALAGVPTIASPVGAFARAIDTGVNGYLAATPQQWHDDLTRLLGDPALRRRMAQAAFDAVLWQYGPERRTQLMRRLLVEWQGGSAGADAFALELGIRSGRVRRELGVPAGQVVWSVDTLRPSDVTVAIPLFNYAHTVVETLESVRAQTLADLDLVIVDDASTDSSLKVALDWARAHAARFNRVAVVRNAANAGLGLTRNAAFSAAETQFVLPLDADNLLRPDCCASLLAAMRSSEAAFAYPVIQEFGGRSGRLGTAPYHPSRFVGGNYIDAMALVAKSAWSAVGGYAPMRSGWEDYEFWCAIAELGLHGHAVGGEPLADYRVHDTSMLAQVTDLPDAKRRVIQTIESLHPWVSVALPLPPSPREPGLVQAADRAAKV